MSNNVRKCKFYLRTADHTNSPLIPKLGRVRLGLVRFLFMVTPAPPLPKNVEIGKMPIRNWRGAPGTRHQLGVLGRLPGPSGVVLALSS